jgi:hypothetical protein
MESKAAFAGIVQRGMICFWPQRHRRKSRLNSAARRNEELRRLRQATTMPLRWIAQGLNVGAAGYLANLLRCVKKE